MVPMVRGCVKMSKVAPCICINKQNESTGDPKKMSLSVFELKSVLDVGFDFSACGLETESRARFISPL